MTNENQTPTTQVLLYLIECAIQRRRITYTDLAVRLGLSISDPNDRNEISNMLFMILKWACEQKLPKLTSLVVRRGNCPIPGPGFWKEYKLENESTGVKRSLTNLYQNEVFDHFGIFRTNDESSAPMSLDTSSNGF